jgi:hypothetical protein
VVNRNTALGHNLRKIAIRYGASDMAASIRWQTRRKVCDKTGARGAPADPRQLM